LQVQRSAAKSDRKRSSAQKSPTTKLGAGNMSAVNADVLRVRRPVLQDDESDDGNLATSLLQPVTTDQQTADSQLLSATEEHGELLIYID